MVTDYQIALIIITIIGFIITTAFYIYFVYLPAARAEAQFEIINNSGENLITLVNQRLNQFESETAEDLISVCKTIKNNICSYNHNPLTGPCDIPPPTCVLPLDAYPLFCRSIVPFTNTCSDCPT